MGRKIIFICLKIIIVIPCFPVAFFLGGLDAVIDFNLHKKFERFLNVFTGGLGKLILKG
jgi:hypothetical protein